MTATEVTLAAVIAGVVMAVLTELGYSLRIIKANLLLIDGEFALKRAGIKAGQPLVHAVGAVVHLITSSVFGAVYYGITLLLGVAPRDIIALATYVFLLWLAMLFLALPVAGQGLLGSRAAASVWYEQLVLHAVFGAMLWVALGLL